MRATLGPPVARARARASLVVLCVSAASCVGSTVADPVPTRTTPTTTAAPRSSRAPIVLATHPTRPPLSVGSTVAQDVLAGRITDWRALGDRAEALRIVAAPGVETGPSVPRAPSDAAAVRAVQRNRRMLAIVPAAAMRAGVRAISVDGIDPLREPHRYPLKAAGQKPGRVVEVIVVGDVMLGRRVGARAAEKRDPSFPLRLVAGRLAAADLTVGNFESTLARLGRPTQGDAFATDPSVLAGLRLAGFDVLSLANNHTGDFGPASLVETVRLLERARFDTVGAGANANAARRAAIVERGGVRFGFLAFNSIGETPPPTRSRPGAVRVRIRPRFPRFVAADVDTFAAGVRALRSRVDVLVVLPHWGEQYTHRAHPDQRRVARALIDAGADLVVGSHPHWVQGLELYRGKVVAYSLGNFVFDQTFARQTQEGLALRLVFWGATLKAVELMPVRIDADYRPRFVSVRDGRSILADVFDVSAPPWHS